MKVLRVAVVGLAIAACDLPPAPIDAIEPETLREPTATDVRLALSSRDGTLSARADRATIDRTRDHLTLEGSLRAVGTGPGDRGTRRDPNSLDIRAERLLVDARGRVATFEDRVVVRSGRMEMSCARLVVRYDTRGQAQVLRASGGVAITYDEGRAFGQIAELDVTRRRLTLMGAPRLSRGGVTLEADRVDIELTSGRATLIRPRGTIALPSR